MKKLLALVLALVMVMGLATVGTSAATEYSDKADINYDEAVAVMSAIGVLEGADGKFRPAAELKRSEAAKIVAYLYYNNKTAAGLIGVGKFNDVPTNHWAAGYVDTLANAGVIAGRGNGAFDPDGDLKVIDFAKMLLVCIGYDPKIEGLVGSDYAINTSKLATQAGLFNGLNELKAGDTLTREQAAQMAFNTVKAATVEYASKGGEITLNGATVSLGNSGYRYVTTTLAKEQRISDRKLTNTGVNNDGGYTVEFGERQYPDLRLVNTNDKFGRPACEWTYGKDLVGKFVNKELLMGTFTTAVTGADLYNLIGEAKIKNSKNINYYVNGMLYNYNAVNAKGGIGVTNMIKGNKVPYPYTGNGVLTEVYEKDDDLILVSILTYWAKADGDFSTRTNELKIKDESFQDKGAAFVAPIEQAAAGQTRVNADDIPAVTKYKNKDPLLVRYAWNGTEFEIAEIDDPKKEEGLTLNKFATGKDEMNGATVFWTGYVVAGEQKNYSRAVALDKLLRDYSEKDKALDTTYTLYYDQYGYVINAVAADNPVKYVFITGFDKNASNLGATYADAFAIFSDGTSKKISVNMTKTNDKIADYDYICKNGVTPSNATYLGSEDFTRAKGYYENEVSTAYPDLTTANLNPYAYNRWFSYSVTGEGANAVYTLTPCVNSIMIPQGADGNVIMSNARENGTNLLTINTKSPILVGSDYSYGLAVQAPAHAKKVYGNDKTNYITVATAPVSPDADMATFGGVAPDANSYHRGIAEVTGVYTGIQNVSLKAYEYGGKGANETETKAKERNPFTECLWAVHDKNDYIVAAVLVGSDGGNSDNYVYALSSAQHERTEGKKYFWDFNAIVDGEVKTLTVEERYDDTFGDAIKQAMKFTTTNGADLGALFKVKLNKEGHVIGAEQVKYASAGDSITDKVYNNFDMNDDTGTTYGDVATDKIGKTFHDEVAYNVYTNAGDTFSFSANTLFNKSMAQYGTNNYDRGLTVFAGAPIYVVQEQVIATTGQRVTIWEKVDTFDQALGRISIDPNGRQLNKADSAPLHGYVSAALNGKGTAKWVAIKAIGDSAAAPLGYGDGWTHTVIYGNNNGTANQNNNQKITLSDYGTPDASHFDVTVTGFTGKTTVPVTIYHKHTAVGNTLTAVETFDLALTNGQGRFTIDQAGVVAVLGVTNKAIGGLAVGDSVQVRIHGTEIESYVKIVN